MRAEIHLIRMFGSFCSSHIELNKTELKLALTFTHITFLVTKFLQSNSSEPIQFCLQFTPGLLNDLNPYSSAYNQIHLNPFISMRIGRPLAALMRVGRRSGVGQPTRLGFFPRNTSGAGFSTGRRAPGGSMQINARWSEDLIAKFPSVVGSPSKGPKLMLALIAY
jgi:hypothetical protein